MILKICKNCYEQKPLIKFHKQSTCKHGRYPICGKCRSNKQHQQRLANAYDAGDKTIVFCSNEDCSRLMKRNLSGLCVKCRV